ncbi:MAG: lysine exporter LysO family protein [Peptococcaceae bacterium]|nr:lysine exporter LysO family protein [Peptococcaceae bacterium]
MLAILVALFVGFALSFFRLLPSGIARLATRISMIAVVVLIGSMGAKIGVDPDLMRNLALFGWQAFVLAVFAVGGSILAVWSLEALGKTKAAEAGLASRADLEQDSELTALANLDRQQGQASGYLLTYLILGAMLLGIAGGYWLMPNTAAERLNGVTDWALYITLWSVGVELGNSKETLRKVVTLGWRVLLVPVGVALGSILGAVLGGLLVHLPFNESAAVGAGFGWYSLSGVLLAQIYTVKLGAIAFLSNVLRELLAVIMIPLLAKKMSPMVIVAPSGATAMDTTLPIVATAAGTQTALIGFVSGVCLSTLVPLLVPFLVKL